MKKLFAIMALVGVLSACNNKKKEEKKTMGDTTTTTTTTTTTPTTETTPATNVAVPTFTDPEVQKFANDYYAFVQEYKTGIMDPAKAQALSKSAMEWSTRSQTITAKLMQNPKEAQELALFLAACAKEMIPSMK
jgi:hypothetical protein